MSTLSRLNSKVANEATSVSLDGVTVDNVPVSVATAPSYTKEYGYVDSNFSTPLTFDSIPKLAYSTDFAVKNNSSEEFSMINITGSRSDQTEEIRWKRRELGNVYAGTNIVPQSMASSKKGVQITASLLDKLSVENDVTGDRVILPIKATLSLTVPDSMHINHFDLNREVQRVFALMYNGTANDGGALQKMYRGSLIH